MPPNSNKPLPSKFRYMLGCLYERNKDPAAGRMGYLRSAFRRTQKGSPHKVRSEPFCMSEDALGSYPMRPADNYVASD